MDGLDHFAGFVLYFLSTSLAPLFVVIAVVMIYAVILLLLSGLPFGRRGQWVWHPECPGLRVWVVRGFWGRALHDQDFASSAEVEEFYRWRAP